MTTITPFLISLPTADRVRAHAFYRDGLGLESVGELADDGVPEPLVVVVNDATRLMLIPTGGFGWVAGGAVAEAGTSECLLGVTVGREEEVDEIVERAPGGGCRRHRRARRQAVGVHRDVRRSRRSPLDGDGGLPGRLSGPARRSGAARPLSQRDRRRGRRSQAW